MKKLLLILTFICLIFLNGCSTSNNLEGTWESDTLILQFDNNQGIISVGSISNYAFGTSTTLYDYYFDYSTNDEKLTLTITGSDSPYDTLERYGTIKMDYTISGDKLTVSNIQLGPNTYPDPITLTKTSSEAISALNNDEESYEESSYSGSSKYYGDSLINLVEYIGKPLSDFETKLEVFKIDSSAYNEIGLDRYSFRNPNRSTSTAAGTILVDAETGIIEELNLDFERSEYNVVGIFVGMNYQTAFELLEKTCTDINSYDDPTKLSIGILKSNPDIELGIREDSEGLVKGIGAWSISYNTDIKQPRLAEIYGNE